MNRKRRGEREDGLIAVRPVDLASEIRGRHERERDEENGDGKQAPEVPRHEGDGALHVAQYRWVVGGALAPAD